MPTYETFFEKINGIKDARDLVAKGLDSAIKKLIIISEKHADEKLKWEKGTLDQELINQLIALDARLNEVNKAKITNDLSNDEIDKRRSQITNNLLTLSSKLETQILETYKKWLLEGKEVRLTSEEIIFLDKHTGSNLLPEIVGRLNKPHDKNRAIEQENNSGSSSNPDLTTRLNAAQTTITDLEKKNKAANEKILTLEKQLSSKGVNASPSHRVRNFVLIAFGCISTIIFIGLYFKTIPCQQNVDELELKNKIVQLENQLSVTQHENELLQNKINSSKTVPNLNEIRTVPSLNEIHTVPGSVKPNNPKLPTLIRGDNTKRIRYSTTKKKDTKFPIDVIYDTFKMLPFDQWNEAYLSKYNNNNSKLEIVFTLKYNATGDDKCNVYLFVSSDQKPIGNSELFSASNAKEIIEHFCTVKIKEYLKI